jgi:hypothetical protein
MKRIATPLLTVAAMCVAVSAFANPNPNSDIVKTYIYADCPTPFSTLTLTNNYPAFIQFTDNHICPSANFENLHNWSFSSDGGATETVFMNADAYRFGFDFQISGPVGGATGPGDGLAEGGLRSSPWWGQETEGRINVKVTNPIDPSNGEIACFGGYMPFYSFTVQNGLHYHLGDMIHLEVIIKPNSLSQTDPGTAEYVVRYNGTSYASGPLPFGPANPNDPPHGTYGPEDDGRAGGVFAPFVGQPPGNTLGNGPGTVTGTFSNVFFTTLPTASKTSTWGQLKSLYR